MPGWTARYPRRGLVRVVSTAIWLSIAAVASGSAGAEPVPVSVGTTSSISDVSLFIADKKGFFRDEGLDVTITGFTSAANMVAPLGAGQLDAGAGSASAGLYNAVARGIAIRIVADKSSSRPGYPGNKLIVRRDLIESGRFRDLRSLRGMRIAMNAPGVSNTSTLNTALASVGLAYDDVTTIDLPFPDHLVALRNKSVDAGVTTEPTATQAVAAGVATSIEGDDEIDPGHQIAVLLYSEAFAKRTAAATRFMRAYLRAVRYYNRALAGGRLAGDTAEEVIEIITEYTPLKDKAVLRAISPTGCDPNGRVNVASLQRDLDFYTRQGLIKGHPDLSVIVDQSFIDPADHG